MRTLDLPAPTTPAEYVAQSLMSLDLYEFWAIESILMGHRHDKSPVGLFDELAAYLESHKPAHPMPR